jgi:hypothetical protein
MLLNKHNSVSRKEPKSISDFEHIIFLGTYNADPFKSKIEKWLPALDLSGTALLVADNHSTDTTPLWMKNLIDSLECFAVIDGNERNLGGYGSLAANLKKLDAARWVTTLHQDDEYSPEHVQNHRLLLKDANPNLGMICSEAISISPDGARLGFPRAHWLLENISDPITVFLAHLRNHVFPFSGATFSKNVLLDFPIPWHSTAFPDTEIVMKLALQYRVEFASGVTVRYLENPNSESHSLSALHRDFGSFQALLRVFAHPNYEKLCQLISDGDLANYLKALDEGISQRFQDSGYAQMMKQAAFEITAQHVGTSPEMATYLAEGYSRVGDSRALEILQSLGASLPINTQPQPQKPTSKSPNGRLTSNIGLLAKLSSLLPRAVRRKLFKSLMKSKFGRTRLASWDFNWRDG